MPNEPRKSSAYAEYLYHMVEMYFLKQGSAFTINQIAEFAKLKPTSNLRRRIRHAVVAGHLAVSTAYAGRCTKSFVYYRPSDMKLGEFPF